MDASNSNQQQPLQQQQAPAPAPMVSTNTDLNRAQNGTGTGGMDAPTSMPSAPHPALLAAVQAENNHARSFQQAPADGSVSPARGIPFSSSAASSDAPDPAAPTPPPPAPPSAPQPPAVPQFPTAPQASPGPQVTPNQQASLAAPAAPAPAPPSAPPVSAASAADESHFPLNSRPAYPGTLASSVAPRPSSAAESVPNNASASGFRVGTAPPPGDLSVSFSGSMASPRGNASTSEVRPRAVGKRVRLSDAPEEEFAGPITVARGEHLYSTSFNPYAMPDLDVLAPHWSQAARASLSGRVQGLMRFFRIAGYLPPPAPAEDDPERLSRKRMRVSRGYESWKCRACGIVLNPVCGETGNARKHISLNKCGGVFAPLEAALLYDTDPEVREALARAGHGEGNGNAEGSAAPAESSTASAAASDETAQAAAWLMNGVTRPATSTAPPPALDAAADPVAVAAASAAAAATATAAAAAAKNGTAAGSPLTNFVTPARKKSIMRARASAAAASDTSMSSPNTSVVKAGATPASAGAGGAGESSSAIAGDVSTSSTTSAAGAPVPLYQQQADGSVVLVGYNQTSTTPSTGMGTSNAVGSAPAPPAIVIGPAFRAPSALAVASYFVAVGQQPEHADSLPWRYLFDGVPGMPTVEAIRDAMRGTR
ncbi:hypothetical protein OC834_003540 [Tilletia horrida]|nr:hypothetical protein OC834_003540 [Tilletia horrida]